MKEPNRGVVLCTISNNFKPKCIHSTRTDTLVDRKWDFVGHKVSNMSCMASFQV